MALGVSPTMCTDPYAELAELAGSFIHEIKNHLSTLGLNLHLLTEDFADPKSHRERRALERVQRLQGECERLVEVSNDFLRFARIQDLDFQQTDLGEVVEDLVDFFGPTAREVNIEIRHFRPPHLPTVRLDRDLFKQALLNLLLNAKQAMPQGGELTILTEAECAGSHSSHIRLILIDNGDGMSADVLAKVFRPFFSTKPGGTGLGLPTTRKIVEAHGGTIDAESEVGRGTKFTIRLPVPSAVGAPNEPNAEEVGVEWKL